MLRGELINLLKEMPIFGGLKEDTLSFILDQCPEISVLRDEYFFQEDDRATSMYVLRQGRVVVLKSWLGRQCMLRELMSGDCFGEMALIDLYPRSAAVKALEDCVAMELSAETFFELYRKDLEAFSLIYMNIAREISRRLRDADEKLFTAAMENKVDESEAVLKSI